MVREKIKKALTEEGEQWLGCGMTYTLFECLKDRIDEMLADQVQSVSNADGNVSDSSEADISKLAINTAKVPKKEQLTKAQKRRQWDHATTGGDKPRGWNWMDIVRHLSQGGSKDESGKPPHN